MKSYFTVLLIFFSSICFASTKDLCFQGDFKACQQVMNGYGRTSKKDGAQSFFLKACAAENLKIDCSIQSSNSSDTLKIALSLAKPSNALFVISGKNVDKIFLMAKRTK